MSNTKIKLYSVGLATFGILGLPCVAMAATTDTVVNANISSTVGLLTSNGTVDLSTDPAGSGSQTQASDTVTVSTNDTAGYTLKLASSTALNTMDSGTDTVAASTGTQASPTALIANQWGYRIDGLAGFGVGTTTAVHDAAPTGVTFAAVPVSSAPDTIQNTNTTATNAITTVWYGLSADTSLPTGNYTNTVTYTVVTN